MKDIKLDDVIDQVIELEKINDEIIKAQDEQIQRLTKHVEELKKIIEINLLKKTPNE